MEKSNEAKTTTAHRAPAMKRVLQGGGIALLLISIFLLKAGPGKPEWSDYWMLRPLVVVTLAGACGGFFYFLMDRYRIRGGLTRVCTDFLCLLVYIVGLWLGSVLGLDGTWWD